MENGNKYRLQEINDIKQKLNDERLERDTLSKRYRRAVTVINGVDIFLSGITAALGSAVICLLSTAFFTAPVLIALEAVAVGTEVVRLVGSQTNKKLVRKAEKHEKIKVLAEAKLSSITDLISKALTDDKISENEYSLIVEELNKFRKMKEKIRTKAKKQFRLRRENSEPN